MIPLFVDKSKLPHKAGVYIFKNKPGSVIYVGKAIDLYHRVSSYFSNSHTSGGNVKLLSLVEEIFGIETIIVESELEALILEANLIKKYLPAYNVRLTDDRDYLYIGLTSEEFPKVVTARKKDLPLMKKFWGPFPSGRTVRNTLKQLRRVFPWCSGAGYKKRSCFYYHLGQCPGACAGVIGQKDYNQIINRFAKFMDGKKEELMEQLAGEMEQASEKLDFEQAQRLKKVIGGVSYLTQTNRVSRYLENPNFLQDETKQALVRLQSDLSLPALPQRIEGFDISNIQGKDATGSMAVLTGGDIDKSQYRKFKIRLSGRSNDVAMHKEMMHRRFNHPEWPLPDLIIVDGGRGQAGGVKQVLDERGLAIPVFGLAKRMEWLYPPKGETVKLSKRSLSLRLLQKLRDESHRFAVNYHRKLREQAIWGY